MPDPAPAAYLAKAQQNLAAAELALQASLYDASGSRAYYAAFQAAVAALWAEGIRPPREQDRTLSHQRVQNEWSGRLVYRRKLYPAALRDILRELRQLRIDADYHVSPITERRARRAVLEARQVVAAVNARLTV
jgi:uncharacterized protein (UPF0332 family)